MQAARGNLARNRTRVIALEELHALAVALGADLGRPPDVFEVIRSADSDGERERRLRLVRQLRTR